MSLLKSCSGSEDINAHNWWRKGMINRYCHDCGITYKDFCKKGEMMKIDKEMRVFVKELRGFLYPIGGVIIALCAIGFLFLMWGGRPQGIYWKVEDLKKIDASIDEDIYKLFKKYVGLKTRINDLEKNQSDIIPITEALRHLSHHHPVKLPRRITIDTGFSKHDNKGYLKYEKAQ